MGYEHVEVEKHGHVGTVWLNRPEKKNALSADMWADIPRAVGELDDDDSIRAMILAARGSAFCVGIDLAMLGALQQLGGSTAETNRKLYHEIKELQETASAFAATAKPVVAAIQGWCLGAGMDLVTACDLRLASEDAVFSIRETRMGLVADTGVLQRLPAIVGAGITAELAYTGEDFDARWAAEKGLVNALFQDAEAVQVAAFETAEKIAYHSPLVTQGIKRVLAAADGRTVEEALDHVAQWNASFLISNDLLEAINSFMEKRDPNYTGT
ncbi:MAG: crotonase/enoyl-CoA hydratase family protein [Acidimicrobiia bacterium]|nr:crotonase/enoyl-CoA hydratase family protein [Acidimicrobiia bacterium]